MSREPYVDGKAAAAYLGISHKTVERRVHERSIPFHKVGRLVRFRYSELDAWVAECTEATVDQTSRGRARKSQLKI